MLEPFLDPTVIIRCRATTLDHCSSPWEYVFIAD